MVRTQVQIPEVLHERVRAIAEAHEWTFSEAMRRAAEMLVRTYPSEVATEGAWSVPTAKVGKVLAPYDRFRELANER